jgi:glycosyltransferase involved in cell wall biosynthesis
VSPSHSSASHRARPARSQSLAQATSRQYLNEDDIQKIALLLIGKAENKTTQLIIEQKIETIQKNHPGVVVIFKNEFVHSSYLKSYFNQCDIVLIPYKSVETSSGIVGHAIASGKPVIGTNKGLLGELIFQNNLGLTIERVSPRLISQAIKESIHHRFFPYINAGYLEEHSPERFAEIIIHSTSSHFPL